MPCSQCWPWTLPLHWKASEMTDGRVIPMRYEQWIIWSWHVVTHQGLDTALGPIT